MKWNEIKWRIGWRNKIDEMNEINELDRNESNEWNKTTINELTILIYHY